MIHFAMFEWKKICCAVDFGEPSRIALAQAADLAKRLGADLLLVHVFVPPAATAGHVLVMSESMTSGVEIEQEMLERWRADAERRSGRPAQARVLLGDPAEKIVQVAQEERCDAVVVGTHGRKGLQRVVLGSVAERITRHCKCPVLVVHDGSALEKQEVLDELAQYR